MIVAKKPCRIYDVDLIGLAAVIALGLAAWWLAIAPWQGLWDEYRMIADKRIATELKLGEDILAWEAAQQKLAELEQMVLGQLEKAPRVKSFAQLLREVTAVAEEAELELISVAPHSMTVAGAYQVSDIEVAARGRSHDFIRFLDRLAQENPYQSLQACTIGRRGGRGATGCDLTWTTRLYLLPDATESSAGGPL